MGFKVTVTPSNIEFNAESENFILDDALAAKINFPHGCKNGACAACKCKITSGEISLGEYNKSVLTDEEIAEGYTLLCKSHAESDIVIDMPGFVNGFPIRTLPAKIEAIEKIGTVAVLKLKLPANQQFNFYAGQYIDIMYNGKNRSYSLANSPSENGVVELHIRFRPGGAFSEVVWNELKVGQILRFTGPLGSFTLKDSDKKILMVCTGTGFAPIKSILEYMVASNNKRPIQLIWGNYTAEDFYHTEFLDKWVKELNFSAKLCINEGNHPEYYTGMVTDYIVENFPDLSQHEIYACGNVAMIENLYVVARSQLQLGKTDFYSDAFTPSPDSV